MANIAVQRIKREFKEVLKSEEVRNELPDIPHPSPGREGSSSGDPSIPGSPWVALLAVALLPVGEQQSPPASVAFSSPPWALGWTASRAGGLERNTVLGGRWRGGHFLGEGVSSGESPEAVATAGSLAVGCGGSRPSLRKPGKWVGGRGKVVTGSGELRCSKAHTFKGILHYGLFGLHRPFLWEGSVKGLRF